MKEVKLGRQDKALQQHSYILIVCSLIGFLGHYYQFKVWRITPWIPATIGSGLLFIDRNKYWLNARIPIFKYGIALGFGLIVTAMWVVFLPQEFQPIRKKIVFGVMSLSSIRVAYLMVLNRKNIHK